MSGTSLDTAAAVLAGDTGMSGTSWGAAAAVLGAALAVFISIRTHRSAVAASASLDLRVEELADRVEQYTDCARIVAGNDVPHGDGGLRLAG